ncbi:MAG: hypothetical protein GEU90_16505 [Gemmatimonas sp.]|nr:hypothetical protein [Gemmatimonas sp.]
MMVHLEEGALQALLDGELDREGTREAEHHLVSCAECGLRLADLQNASAVLSAALGHLDTRLVLSVSPGPLTAPPSIRRRRWSTAPLRRAVVLLVTGAAAASATIPGSPVRRWIGERLALTPAPTAFEVSPDVESPAPELASEPPPESGVSVEPIDGRLRIVFDDAAPGLQVRVRLADSPRGGVFAIGDATAARFQTAPGLIEVLAAGAGEVRVEIPRSAASASVIIDGRPYLVKEGDALRLEAPARDSSATEVLFEVDP